MASPSEPVLPSVWRASLPVSAAVEVPWRQLRWVLAQSAVLLVLTAQNFLPYSYGSTIFGLGLGAGVAAAHPKPKAILGILFTAAAAYAADLMNVSEILMGGLAAGLCLGWLSDLRSGWRLAQTAVGVAAGTGLGLWVGTTLVGQTWPFLVGVTFVATIAGLIASQVEWIAALRWRQADRIPSPGRIRATLSESAREPALRAWNLDQSLAKAAPDPETRDGLGEVAAWVYRLAWSRQNIETELTSVEGEGLAERIAVARQTASAEQDAFTRERREAAVRHLEQLVGHRDALALEAGRTAALMDYALAFLEQARAGLALSRVSPGEQVPERLSDVLGRLRAHATDGDARRRTARQLSSLV